MATQTIEFRSAPTQTTTAKLFAVGSDTQVASVTATEATNRKGTYSAAYTDVAAGEYELIAFVGAVPVARWFVTLTLTTATFQVYDKSKTELIAANAVNASSLATDAVTEIQSGLATQASVDTIQSDTNDIQTRLPATLESGRIAAVLDSAVGTQIDNIENASGYLLAVLAGECADPQTASETYAITVFGSTFTVDMAGQTSTGTRTAPTLTKT